MNSPNLFYLLPNNNKPSDSDYNQAKESDPKEVISVGEIPNMQNSDYVTSEELNERKRKLDQMTPESIDQVKDLTPDEKSKQKSEKKAETNSKKRTKKTN